MDTAFSERLAKLFDEAAGVADGLRQDADGFLRARIGQISQELDLVPREEFDAVREMAIRARAENARLEKRVTLLEKRLKARRIRPLRRKNRHIA